MNNKLLSKISSYICTINFKLAECVALWGEPEQAVHGMKERRAAVSSDMKGEKEKQVAWLLLLNLHGMYSHSSALISGTSAVSLVPRPEDRTRLCSSLRLFSGPPSSPSLFCTGMLGVSWKPEATLVSLGYLSSCSSSTPCFLWAYSACAVFGLLFQQRRALSRSILRFSLRCLRG